MVFCGKTSTEGLACFRKGIGVGKGLVMGKLPTSKKVKKTRKDRIRDKELARVRRELKQYFR
jgi:hypothetical protein|tara:strand:+ start:616 stop:801 length:186 start_codon:yes stop_codon:yes gene_type:complete